MQAQPVRNWTVIKRLRLKRQSIADMTNIDIADTISVGTPQHTREVFEAVTQAFPRIPRDA